MVGVRPFDVALLTHDYAMLFCLHSVKRDVSGLQYLASPKRDGLIDSAKPL